MTVKFFSTFLTLTCTLFAASPKTVTHDSKTAFERGTLANVAITHDGTLKPAPVKTLLLDTGEPFVWSAARDSQGSLYLGTGNDGKIFKLTAQGDSTLILDVDELFIFALLVDKKDNVYAATSPNGKVYKITTLGESSIFFDPDAAYIWDLALDAQDNILIATGEPGSVTSVSPQGKSTTVLEAEENHVRTLLVDDKTIYAGTSGRGFVYRLTADADPFVIFDPQMEEVNQLLPGRDGYLYASAFGQAMTPTPPANSQEQKNQNGSNGTNSQDNSALASQVTNLESIIRSGSAPTSLFRIAPDGFAKDLWSGSDEKIQSIFPYGENILIGSGTSGKLLTVNPNGDLSILLENGEMHVTSFLKNRDDNIIFTTSNLGRVYRLEETAADTASFMSETIDAGLPAQWGTLVWQGNAAASTTFYTRSGNTEQPSQTWSTWQPVKKDGQVYRIASPNARFVQWKFEMKNREATIDKVSLSYIQKNLAPSLSSVIIHRPNDFFKSEATNGKPLKGITFPSPLPNKQTKKSYRTVDWLFEDPNFDALCFDLYYRRAKSGTWRKMASDLEINYYAWDSAQMADGDYEIKVVASDKTSNPENLQLTGEKISKPFTIDNSGPTIQPGNKKSANVLTVRISDDWTLLDNVQVSIDALEWKTVFPVDGILDSKAETFDIQLPDDQPHDVAIKASDKNQNVSVVHTATK